MDLLDEFKELTKVERIRELDTTESNRYHYLWEELKRTGVEIPLNKEI